MINILKDSSCLIGITLLLSSILSLFLNKNKDIFIKFNDLLNEKQKNIYNQIINERISIYVIGIILGIVSGIYYYIRNKNDKYRLCKFLMIIYLVKFGFYYFYPKKPLMLYSLNTKEQINTWADIYIEMKNRFKLSLLLGFIGYLFIYYFI